MRVVAIALTFLLVLAGGPEILADPGGGFDPGCSLMILGTESPLLTPLEGEITSVSEHACVLGHGAAARRFEVPEGIFIIADGHRVCVEYIRPVARHAYFWARLWFNRAGALVIIEAVYVGEELILIGIGSGFLAGYSPEDERSVVLPVREGFALEGFKIGGSIYVLLDLEGRVRWAVPLPKPL